MCNVKPPPGHRGNLYSFIRTSGDKKSKIYCKNPIIYFNTAFYFQTSHWKKIFLYLLKYTLLCPCLGNVFPDSLFTLGKRSCLSEVTHFICLPQDQKKKKKKTMMTGHWKTHGANLDNKMTELPKREFFTVFNKSQDNLKETCNHFIFLINVWKLDLLNIECLLTVLVYPVFQCREQIKK